MKTSGLVKNGVIAAIYAALTLAVPAIGFGVVQFRIGEAMCVLPYFMPSSVWGLTVGCLISNAIGTAMGVTTVWDIVFGTLATAIAALLASRIKNKWLVPLPAVVINAVIIGVMLTCVMTGALPFVPLMLNMSTIGISQLVSCYGLGMPLLKLFERIGFSKYLSK